MCEYFITCLGNQQDILHLYGRDLERQPCDCFPGSDHLSWVINMDPALGTVWWQPFENSMTASTDKGMESWNRFKSLCPSFVIVSSALIPTPFPSTTLTPMFSLVALLMYVLLLLGLLRAESLEHMSFTTQPEWSQVKICCLKENHPGWFSVKALRPNTSSLVRDAGYSSHPGLELQNTIQHKWHPDICVLRSPSNSDALQCLRAISVGAGI